jgi:basic membrane lipoprotein Med (substrate-binding protein (PBP1-ABC) superfamily)
MGSIAGSGGCSLVVERDLKTGIGESCQTAADCQGDGADCTRSAAGGAAGVCTTGCTTDADCPTGSVCSPAGNRCQPALKIGAIYIGNSGEGWTKTHADGLAEVSAALGYPKVTATENVVPGAPTKELVEKYIADGNKVILATSTSYNGDIVPLAAAHPDVKFLVCEGSSVTQNLGSYYGRREQAWYIAGEIAAKSSRNNKLGVIGTYVGPDTVRNINAFLLGARRQKPTTTVEVRWSGFWFDYSTSASFFDGDAEASGFCTDQKPCYLEEYLADKMLAGGVDVVTHQADVDRTINFVESWNKAQPAGTPPAYSVANNNRYGCRSAGSKGGNALPACLSAVYWNWAPLYTQTFTQMRFNEWTPANVYENILDVPEADSSIVGVEQSDLAKTSFDQVELNNLVKAIATNADPYFIFSRGATRDNQPYNTNDRPGGPVTGTLSEDEVLTMCWFAEGVVEQKDDACSENPKGVGCDTVAARVPRGDRSPWKALPPFGETGNAAFDCTKHGGK